MSPYSTAYDSLDDLREETLLVDGMRLFARTGGTGDATLLFIHGWADSSVVWRRSMRYWGDRYRTVALDQPGHGRSSPTPVAGGAPAIAARLAAAIAMLDPRDLTLVGHSFGGLMALLIAQQAPELVARLVLVDAAWYGPEIMPVPLPAALRHGLALAGMTLLRPLRRLTAPLLAPLLTRVDGRYEDQFRRWHALTQAEPWWLARTAGMIQQSDLSAVLPRIGQPALVITGTADRTVPPRHARQLAARLPDARLVEIRGAGHHPMEDDFPAFSAAVDGFLASGR